MLDSCAKASKDRDRTPVLFMRCYTNECRNNIRAHEYRQSIFTTPRVLVVNRKGGGLTIAQAIQMKDFRGRAIQYELRALVNFSDGRYVAEVRTEVGWAECGEQAVHSIEGRGASGEFQSDASMLFYARTGEHGHPGPGKNLARSFGRAKPEEVVRPYELPDSDGEDSNEYNFEVSRLLEVNTYYPMPGYVSKLLTQPEFHEVDDDEKRTCVVCDEHDSKADVLHHFYYMPCGHQGHKSCLKEMFRYTDNCGWCRLKF